MSVIKGMRMKKGYCDPEHHSTVASQFKINPAPLLTRNGRYCQHAFDFHHFASPSRRTDSCSIKTGFTPSRRRADGGGEAAIKNILLLFGLLPI
jgi:hypothetical protein